jgi:hypothetical protein
MSIHYRYYPRFGSFSDRYANSPIKEEERRRKTRKPCAIPVDYAVDDHPLKGLIQNLSSGGALLSSGGGHFLVGQEISMSFLMPPSGERVKSQGKVAWRDKESIGVRFKDMDSKSFDRDLSYFRSAHEKAVGWNKKTVNPMGKARRKKVSWKPSTSADVSGYRLYWAMEKQVNYDSQYIELGNITDVTLPDDIPSLIQQAGNLQLGVTAISQSGNESDMTTLSAFIDFRLPEAPQELEIENI